MAYENKELKTASETNDNTKHLRENSNTRCEFESVYKELYSNDESHQSHAVGRIFVWKSRVLHKLPVAIESTASLISAVVEYKKAEKSDLLQENHHKLQSAISLALIRFVNHITEKGQTRQYAQPVHILAAELGVPEWIVELRHNATHGSLPSLAMLKAAVKWALQWLKVEFWEKQLESMSADVSTDISMEYDSGTDEHSIRKVLLTYQEEKVKEFQDQQEKDRAAIGRVLDCIERYFISNRTTAIGCLLEEGCLMSSQQQVTALQIDVNNLENQLPDKLVSFWKPVLRLLHHLKLTSLLLRQMVAMVTTEMSFRNQMLCGWMYTIITANSNAGKSLQKNSGIQLYKSSISLPARMLLGACIKVPSLYTAPVIKLLMSKQVPPLSKQKKQQLTHVLDLLIDPASSCHFDENELDSDNDRKIFTVQDASVTKCTKEISEATRTKISDNVDRSTQWELCTDAVDWSQIPVGYLPGQKIGYFDLELKLPSIESHSSSSDIEVTMDTQFTEEDEETEKCSDDQSLNNGLNIWTQQDMVKLKQMVQLL